MGGVQNRFSGGALLSAPKLSLELILERAGPVIFKTFLLELMAFRRIPVIFLSEDESLKINGNDN